MIRIAMGTGEKVFDVIQRDGFYVNKCDNFPITPKHALLDGTHNLYTLIAIAQIATIRQVT